MKIIKVKSRRKVKKNPKKGAAKMAKKRKNPKRRRKVAVKTNPRKKYRRKARKNPVMISRRRKHRRNPSLNVKGIFEQLKPIALGAAGALIVSKLVSFIPFTPEQETYKPWAKMAIGAGVAYFGRKYAVLRYGGIFFATMAAYNKLGESFPTLVAGTDDFDVVGYDGQYLENELLGNQVQFNGEDGEMGGDQVAMGSDSYNRNFDGF